MPRPTHISLRPLIVTVLAVLALGLLPAGAGAAVETKTAGLEGGSFSEFSQTNAVEGDLEITASRVYDGARAMRATYSGQGANGYIRGIWNVNWTDGDDVWFGAAYYLPVGFHDNIQGQVDLVRWDNWTLFPDDADWGGVGIYGSDHRARLLRFGAGRPNETLVGPIDLPEGRWFTLEVHQRRSAVDGEALSELYIDGQLIGRSTKANSYGRPATRIRYGIVAMAEGTQTNPLELWVDNASMGNSSALGAEAAPAPVPEPAVSSRCTSNRQARVQGKARLLRVATTCRAPRRTCHTVLIRAKGERPKVRKSRSCVLAARSYDQTDAVQARPQR
jgi:hypothetical protein